MHCDYFPRLKRLGPAAGNLPPFGVRLRVGEPIALLPLLAFMACAEAAEHWDVCNEWEGSCAV